MFAGDCSYVSQASEIARLVAPIRAVRADQDTEQLDSTTLKLISDITKTVDDKVASTVSSNTEAAKQVNLQTSSELRTKVEASIRKLSVGLLERETEVRRASNARIMYTCFRYFCTVNLRLGWSW